MASVPEIGKRFTIPSSSADSFREELRELLWSRGIKALWVGLVATLLMAAGAAVLLGDAPRVVSDPRIHPRGLWIGHPASFAVALAVLYVLRERACAFKIQLIAFLVFASNIVLIMFLQICRRPDLPDFFSLSLALFVPAAFIPWRAFHQLLLGAVAIVSFLTTQFLGLRLWPEVTAFWSERTGGMDHGSFASMVTLGIVVLTLVSHAISRTLYTLNRTKHAVASLGNYVVEDEIGEGGMGKVLLARHRMICRPSAVKVMTVPEGDSETSLRRFEREVNLSASLTHPNTIQIFDFGRSGENVFYYAMEYLSGLDLQRLVERFGPMSAERAVFVLLQVCGSLAEAHSKGIVHRDIKPSNIFLTERGGLHDFVKVLDFGLAKRVQATDAASVTKSGMVFGTPRYISPEALYGDDEIDGRADLYNLGGVAYWLLTGKPPFDTSSSVDLIIDHVRTVPLRPSQVSEVPILPALEDAVMRLLEKKAEDRFQSAEELRRALDDVTAQLPAWSWERAREWWSLHGLPTDRVPVCA